MSFTVTNIGVNNAIGSTVSVTVGTTIPAGTDVIVCATDPNSGTGGTVSDSKSNTYTLIQREVLGGSASNGNGYAFRSNLTTQLVSGDTITFHAAGSSLRPDISVFSVTGGNGLDSGATAATTSSGFINNPSVTSGTPAQSGELFVGVICHQGTATLMQPAGGWTNPPNPELVGGSVDGGHLVNSGASAVTYNPTLSGTSRLAAIIFAIIPAAAAVTWFPMDVEKQPNFAKTDVIGY